MSRPLTLCSGACYLSYDVPSDYPIEHLRGKYFNFEWQSVISGRALYNYGCPYLCGQAVWKGFNDLRTISPEIAEEWNPILNRGRTPEETYAYSADKVWWLCSRGHEWYTRILNRTKMGNGCPECYKLKNRHRF